jgi:hypothetical protein
MQQDEIVRRQRVEAAAIAGVAYAILAVVAWMLLGTRPSPSSSEQEWALWISDAGNRRLLVLGLSLGSVASIAFLWFVAVIRRRIGEREDRFFATVFLGSALVYVGVWLAAIAMLAAPAMVWELSEGSTVDQETFNLAEGFAGGLMLVAGPSIQALFVASSSMMFLRTKVLPKWLAHAGFLFAFLLFSAPLLLPANPPLSFGFPLWVLLASVTILVTRLEARHETP